MSINLSLRSMSPAARDRLGEEREGLADLVAGGEVELLGLGKAWHGLHYLLNGDAEAGTPPFDALLDGGEEFGEDWGYGPPRWLEPALVAEFTAALQGLSNDEVVARYDGPAMAAADVYGGAWDNELEEREFLLDALEALRGFLERAVTAGRGMVVELT